MLFLGGGKINNTDITIADNQNSYYDHEWIKREKEKTKKLTLH